MKYVLASCLISFIVCCNSKSNKSNDGNIAIDSSNFVSVKVDASDTSAIYRLTFSDTSNFNITTRLNYKRPAQLIIKDSTIKWSKEHFWFDQLNNKTPELLRELENEEHGYYNHVYFFKDTALDRKVSDDEKRLLSERCATINVRKIDLIGTNYSTVHTMKKNQGFHFATTEPIFTRDSKFAFITVKVSYGVSPEQVLYNDAFGIVSIVYEKVGRDNWKKIHSIHHLIF
jgi:hypothetical protein